MTGDPYLEALTDLCDACFSAGVEPGDCLDSTVENCAAEAGTGEDAPC